MSKQREPRSFALARLLWYAQREASEMGQAQAAALIEAALRALACPGVEVSRPLSAEITTAGPLKVPHSIN
jgi:hypothetical protein